MGRRLVRDIIRAQRERGATVFLNSHLLSEIEITCDQVVFIREGEVVTSRDLRAAREDEVRVVVRARKLTPQAAAGLAPWCTSPAAHAHDLADPAGKNNDNDNTHENNDQRLILIARSSDALPDILRHLVASGADVYQFTPQRLSLEDLFVSVMGEDRGL